MLINEKTTIIGDKVILVPYKAHHVLKYHRWMEDTELRRLTGSERLTLEEEYQMQRTWRVEDDKCTFILLSRDRFQSSSDEISAMVGDVNIFLSNGVGEIEIMVAEPDFRNRGIGSEALMIMLQYGVNFLKIYSYQAKIVEDNVASIELFKKFGFELHSYSSAFKEYTYVLSGTKLQSILNNDPLLVQPYNG